MSDYPNIVAMLQGIDEASQLLAAVRRQMLLNLEAALNPNLLDELEAMQERFVSGVGA